MKTNSIVKVHPSVLPMLEHDEYGDALIDFLLELERNPTHAGRTFLVEQGVRRIEATKIGDLCVGYDLQFRTELMYPALVEYHPREIYIWEIARRQDFIRHIPHEQLAVAALRDEGEN